MKRLFALVVLVTTLGGCIVVPAPQYEHRHYYGDGQWDHRYDGDRDYRYHDHG
jgi:hypothetical protein